MNNYSRTLELHKILEMLSSEASNEKTRQMIAGIKPETDIDIVRREIKKTSYCLELTVKYGTPAFSNFKNIEASVKRAQSGASLTLRELLDIGQLLYQSRQLCLWYKQAEDGCEENDIDYLFKTLAVNKYLEDKISNSILSDEELADTASSELASIRRKIVNSGFKIKEHLDKMIKSSSTKKYLQDSIVTMRDGRYVVPVKSEYKNEISGLVHDTSASGSTYFIEPMAIVEANNDIRVLKGREQDEIERIIAEMSSECASFGDSLLKNFEICAELNLYFSKANLAAKMNAMCPEIADDGQIILHKARHPLINKDKVVPIDVNLGIDFNTLVITGPNTGGKTVILKTIGLLTLMTMCGLLIPASDGSKISVFRNILVDIGDEQSIEQSLSTFSSHMNRVISILEKADTSSLVLLDELGSGTDPVEGAALAVSIIEELMCKGAKLVTTTHYQELKMYALDTDNVENASCEFDIKSLQPTYRLIIGSPGKSNAFAISSKLGLPDNVIKRAEGLISEENKKFETIMSKLEEARYELEKNNEQVVRYKKQAEELSLQLEKEKADLNNTKEKIIQDARNQATRIVQSVTRQADSLVDELTELRKQKDKDDFSKMAIDAKSKVKSTLNKLYKDANPVSENAESYKLPRELKKGDNVIITDTKKPAIVLTLPDSSGNLFVQAGIMKTKINVSKLRLDEKAKVTFNSSYISTKGVESRATRNVKTELDIRGYASDEGIMETDAFLDNAVMSGLNMVTIIHGKGTGILKNAIRQHLKNHPLVKSSRKGVYGEGEDGVTVVELK